MGSDVACPGRREAAMRVLMITQKIDLADPILAFTIGWIEALAARVDHLHVLCLECQPNALPANVTVHSMGKEQGNSRPQELRAFYASLRDALPQIDVIFCHMIPRYAVLAVPLAFLYRKPLILWYVHRQISLELRLAMSVCRFVATAVPDSFPLPTRKLRALGHGIDAGFFAPNPSCPRDDPPLILQIARLMPIKHQETLLRALAAGIDAKAAFVGNVPPGKSTAYRDELHALVDELKLGKQVTFTGGLKPPAVRDLYYRASIAVNLSPPGLFDKAALESMLCGVPTIVSNPAFDPVLGNHAPLLRIAAPDDVQGLAERLRTLLAVDESARRAIGRDLRERVKSAHGLDGLMDRLVALMQEA